MTSETDNITPNRLVLVIDLAGIDLRDDLTDADLVRHVDLADVIDDPGAIGALVRAAGYGDHRSCP